MQNAIKNYLSGQKKGDDARLQENGWIKIVNHFMYEESNEDWYKSLSVPMPDFEKGKSIRTLYPYNGT